MGRIRPNGRLTLEGMFDTESDIPPVVRQIRKIDRKGRERTMALNIDQILSSVANVPAPREATVEAAAPVAAPVEDTEVAEVTERIKGRFRTIVTKYPGKCLRCMGPVAPGETVRWLAPPRDARGRKRGRGRTYHLAARCPGRDTDFAQDDMAEEFAE